MNITPKTRKARYGRLTAGVALAAAASLALAACSSGGGDTAATTPAASGETADLGDATLQLSWIKNEEFAGEWFADKNGYWTEAGLSSVDLVTGPSNGIAELISGSADVALSDAIATGTAVANEGAPVKIIGATFQKNPFTILSVASEGNILTPEDMKGKKIGVQASNTPGFEAFLAANGMTTDDVTIVPVEYDPSVLIDGQVDGFMAYLTNESLTVAAQGIEVANLPFADNGMPFVAETYTATDEAIASERPKLKALLLGAIKGWYDNIADPEEGARLAVEEYGVDLDLDPELSLAGNKAQLELVQTEETDANGIFTISDDLQAQTLASLSAAGLELEAGQLFDMSLVSEIYAENPDLIAG